MHGVVTHRVKQYAEYRLPELNSRPEFLHKIHTFVTPCCKRCEESQLSALNNMGSKYLLQMIVESPLKIGGLPDRSTALYFYKRLKTSLHKPKGNLLENLFSKKYAFKNNLQLLEKKFLSQTNTTPKNGILLSKWPIFKYLQYFSNW